MKFTEGKIGRVFIIRLEDGDPMPATIENFAAEHGIAIGYVCMIGDLGQGEIIGGPVDTESRPIQPQRQSFTGPFEGTLVGLLCPGHDGQPDLHLHGAMGRQGETITGCYRVGFEVWLMGEVILYEILGTTARRMLEPDCGFPLLEPTGESDGRPALKLERPILDSPVPPEEPSHAKPPEPTPTISPVLCLVNADVE